jgi:hypothetical protein
MRRGQDPLLFHPPTRAMMALAEMINLEVERLFATRPAMSQPVLTN